MITTSILRRKTVMLIALCLFIFSTFAAVSNSKKNKTEDERVYLLHSDELRYDQFGLVPNAQIVKGKVQFLHKGAYLWCDSAYFYQESNSFYAFGNVRMKQGDTLSLTCQRAYYDGNSQMLEARQNVILKHREQTLKTDSLNYDRLYENAYFFEGGTLTDKTQRLVSDWGQYFTNTREASFYFNVKMTDGDKLITTDTLHYNTLTSQAHVLGPSRITTKTSTIKTTDAYLNTKTDYSQLYARSTIEDGDKEITADSLFHDNTTGQSDGYGSVIYRDKKNHNALLAERVSYNDKTGQGYATGKAIMQDYSQGPDTLYVHADSIKLYTHHLNTDSMYRKAHCFYHARAYRTDLQAVCDSLTASSKDSCLILYRDPIVWSDSRQILGDSIKVFIADSTIREVQVLNNALMIEAMPDTIHYNQISSRDMFSYFNQGILRRNDAISNVTTIYYTLDDKDSTIIGLNYLTTDTMRMYISEKKELEKIRTNKFDGTLYPLNQAPKDRTLLPTFAWYSHIRPKDKNDIFIWRSKK